MRTLAQLAERPQIAFFDIETAPYLGWVWQKYDTNVIQFVQQSYMLCFSVKYSNSPKVETYSLPDFPMWKKEASDKSRHWYEHNDKELVMKLWQIMGEADLIIAHNGDSFDTKYTHERMIVHGLSPPDPYKTVDTLKLARKHFRFISNKLDDIANDLKLGRKIPHTGFALWEGCMKGDMRSWDLMKRYNKQDVLLLERVYLKFRPWATTHPNVKLYKEQEWGCPKCGSMNVTSRGKAYTTTQVYRRYQCRDCGGWYRGENVNKDG